MTPPSPQESRSRVLAELDQLPLDGADFGADVCSLDSIIARAVQPVTAEARKATPFAEMLYRFAAIAADGRRRLHQRFVFEHMPNRPTRSSLSIGQFPKNGHQPKYLLSLMVARGSEISLTVPRAAAVEAEKTGGDWSDKFSGRASFRDLPKGLATVCFGSIASDLACQIQDRFTPMWSGPLGVDRLALRI
jgi:hypothetical protein